MGERLYSWPSDRKVATALHMHSAVQPQLYQQPPFNVLSSASVFPDYNNMTGAGQRFFNNSSALQSYTSMSGIIPGKYLSGVHLPVTSQATPMHLAEHLEVAHGISSSSSCLGRNRYIPYNFNRYGVDPSHSSQHSQHQYPHPQIVSACTSTYAYHYAGIYQQHGNIGVKQTMPSSISPVALSGPVLSSVPIIPSVNNLVNRAITSSAGMPCFGAATTDVAGGIGDESEGRNFANVTDANDAVTLQITNLDYSLDESNLRSFLMNQLKPITPVVSLVFEGSSYAKVTVPDLYFAKQVVSNLHRKKIGHKRMLVSYTRDSSTTEVNTLRCQVAGLLKDVPYYTLPMYKFRELFQSRFKTSISVLDLYKMQDICTINSDNNEEKFISLQPDLVNTLESSPLMEGLQHSVPYCTVHFKREQHKGWAEQEIEPLPNVCMTISEIQKLIYPLMRIHPGDIPVATLIHCIEGQLKVSIVTNESGINLEHLVCCVHGIQVQVNNFGIKILGWLELNKNVPSSMESINCSYNNNSINLSVSDRGSYFKNSAADPLFQISREVIELVKMSPKSTIKFNRFIPAYHNHFGKQCRVADYGYTKLIELFEALSSVVQIMGDGENRQITLTHRTQIRRFTSDLMRVLRANGNNSLLLSQLPVVFGQTQNRNFDVTDYGVCDIVDILDGLVNSNIVVLNPVHHGKDILISMPKRKQTSSELEKTFVFAGEMVELFQNALQYTILFQKFVRSYHYHFGYQCRLSDYGFLKLADLMDAIHGLVDMEMTNDEDKKIILSPTIARRVFAEQCEKLIRNSTGNTTNCMKLNQVLKLHKKKYGYQIQPLTLGVSSDMAKAVEMLPYVEVKHKDHDTWLICHSDNVEFRLACYRACKFLLQQQQFDAVKPTALLINSDFTRSCPVATFLSDLNTKHKLRLTESALLAMRHFIDIYNDTDTDLQCVRLTAFTKFLMNIVSLLEQRPNMYLYEIKSALECGLTTTFEFGYPNLYSLVAAYDDIFTINNGPTQERSDVTLNVNCELRLSNLQDLFGCVKFPYEKQRAQQRSFRTIMVEHSRPSYSQAPPSHKIHAVANEGGTRSVSNLTIKPQVNNLQTYEEYLTNTAGKVPARDKCSPPSTNSSLLSSLESCRDNCSLYNTNCYKENSIHNSSLKLFNSSFNSSGELNASLGAGDLTNITSSIAIVADGALEERSSSKLWHRRQPRGHNSGSDSAELYESIRSINESQKIDTALPEKIPFWIDPIWSNRSEPQPSNNVLNIRVPELKSSHNVFPTMLLSPYTISKNENLKRKLFNFDNHDRKIS